MDPTFQSAELPPYRAIMVVDMKNFSGEKGRDHARITESIPMILGNAFHRCGCAQLWSESRFHGTTGDGYFVGFDTRWTPFLLNPVLSALQDELEYQNRVHGGDGPIRMRVSLTAGPMTDSGLNSLSDGSGDTRIEAHRMLDGKAVRAALADSSSATCVAAIVSEQVYRDVVLSGYSGDDPGLYVDVGVEVKTYEGKAYLRVPKPSGDVLRSGLTGPGDAAEAPGEAAPPATPPAEAQGERSRAAPRYVGVETAQGSVGTVVTGEGNTVNSGGGNQFNGVEITGTGPTVLGTNRGPAPSEE
ncbi:hypothetical protein GCM10009676_01060 [Prauserella halophila]|uniref:Guanylate cyclase domain-containing protein n=1 Tax=Prauserella halophila TaxID=185641 RepID=A0ABP4GFB6_9PSEU|nr:hypothetical protein [Prauserella halophila]MCP2234550.1 hypothetical protein [Prauserella halophila]